MTSSPRHWQRRALYEARRTGSECSLLLATLTPEGRDQVMREVLDLLKGRGAKFVELVIAALPPYCSSAPAGELLAIEKAAQDEDLFALILLHLGHPDVVPLARRALPRAAH